MQKFPNLRQIYTPALFFVSCPLQVFARTTNVEATHPSFGPIKQLASQLSYLVPDNIHLYGENMFGVHSIEYDGLRSYFYLFAALEDGSRWLSWDKVVEIADEVDVPMVPVVARTQVKPSLTCGVGGGVFHH